MAWCRCGKPVEAKRATVGLLSCFNCGEIDAERERKLKQLQVGPAFSKGGYQYLGGENLRQNLLDAGRKTSQVIGPETYTGGPRTHSRKPKTLRTVIGYYWTASGDRCLWHDGDDLTAKGAVRSARLR